MRCRVNSDHTVWVILNAARAHTPLGPVLSHSQG